MPTNPITQHRIHKLSPLIISQIAAGEVIDRPASVVKELVENAIDAGAKRIVIQTWQGGMSRIDVSDDGVGIVADDLSLSVMRHTTSKLATEDVLGGVHTLGFRGEALASIAAVARLKIASSADDTGIGREISVEGDALEDTLLAISDANHSEIHVDDTLKPVAMSRGTHVSVQALFFNVPARRRFLKSIATEFGHIEAIIRRLALNYFDIGFELWHQDQLRLSVNAVPNSQSDGIQGSYHGFDNASQSAQKKRLATLLDANFAESAQSIQVSFEDGMANQETHGRLTGWLSTESTQQSKQLKSKPKKKPSAKYQYWFVNGRLVQNRALKQLVQNSLQQAIANYCTQADLLTDLQHDIGSDNSNQIDTDFCITTLSEVLLNYVLFLQVPDETVNVNIHPTKLDVRLENEQQISTLVGYFLQKHLRSIFDVNAADVLASASVSKQAISYSNFGKAVCWSKKQLLNQTDTGFLLIKSKQDLPVSNQEEAANLLTTWQETGQPEDVSITNIPFDKLLAMLSNTV